MAHPTPADNVTELAVQAIEGTTRAEEAGDISAGLVLAAIPLCVLLFSLVSLAVVMVIRARPEPQQRRGRSTRSSNKEH